MMMPFCDYVYVGYFFLHCYYGIDHHHLHNHIVDASPYMIFFLFLQGPNQLDHLEALGDEEGWIGRRRE